MLRRAVRLQNMALADDIRLKIAAGHYEFSKHAVDQSILRRIALAEIRGVMLDAEVIEDYPNDKYGPSCLLLGFTGSRRPLHIQCSYPSRPLVKIITLYEPDLASWTDFRRRRK